MLLSLVIVIFFLVRNHQIQSYIVQYATEKVAGDMNTKISVESARVHFFKRLAFKNVLIEDQTGDTLIFSKKMVLNYRKFNRDERLLSLKKVTFNEADVLLNKDSTQTFNMDFFISYLKEVRDSTKKRLSFEIDEIQLVNSHFQYREEGKSQSIPDQMQFTDMDFNDLNIAIDNFQKARDTLRFTLKNLEFKDKSGFPANHIAGDFAIHNTFIQLNNAQIYTESSRLKTDSLFLRFPDFDSLKNGGFASHADMTIDFTDSRLSLDDLGYFAPVLKDYKNKIHLTSSVRGTLNNLKLRQTTLYYGEDTRLAGNFEMKGLPDVNNTYIFFEIQRLNTTIQDIERVNLATASLSLPAAFNKLGTIEYTGNFSGFINDFVAYGKLRSNLGNLSTDMSLKGKRGENIAFSGQLQGVDFKVGKLLASDDIGRSSFNLKVNGNHHSSQKTNIETAGKVNYLEYKGNPIHNIEINGILSDKKYSGIIHVDDEHLQLAFNGNIDFTENINTYQFRADVQHIHLYNLNLLDDEKEISGSFLLEADMKGNTLNTLNGRVNLLNAYFTNINEEEVQIQDLALNAHNTDDSNYLGIRSDFLDASLKGNYQLDQINATIFKFINKFAPSINGSHAAHSGEFKSNFRFEADFKKSNHILSFFFPQYNIAENTTVTASYDADKNSFISNITSRRIQYKSYVLDNVYINVFSDESLLEAELGSDYLQLSNNIRLDNCTFHTNLANDSLNFAFRWHNWDTLVNKGNVKTSVVFDKNPLTNNTRYNIHTKPSEIVVRDTEWALTRANVFIDSSYVSVDSFTLTHNEQEVFIDGSLSKNASDSIQIRCSNYDMANLNVFSASNGFFFNGKANGDAIITYKNEVPMFISNFNIDSLSMNKEDIGNLKLFTLWNEEDEALDINADLYRGKLKSLGISGRYFPNKDQQLSIRAELDKFRLYTINPYIRKVFSDIRGLCSGNLTLSGNLSNPLINGEMKFLKTSFHVDYLGTRFNFSDKITLNDNQVIMEDIKMYDEQGNSSILNGRVQNDNLKNFTLDLSLQAENLQVLNTSVTDNDNYYGTAYASGVFEITGPVNDLDMSISARTGPRTTFYIPLDQNEEVSEYDFISFVSPIREMNMDTVETPMPQEKSSKISMNFDLQVTPEAEVQIIFDSKVGDIIKGRGEGNINMDINNQGKFNMYGEYNITQGDYLFTLKNIINKKFRIREGSVIYWSGSPSDATIDIEAIYTTKTSVEPLFANMGEGEINNLTSGKVQVHCIISLTGALSSPEIQTHLEFPNANSTTQAALEGRLNNQESINKQFLAIMAVNSFVPDESETFGAVSKASGVTTTTEMLSNQLSNWLSQFSNQFDVGVNYRQANELTQQNWEEVELMVSTQLWEDRVNINVGGNYISENQYQTTDDQEQKIVGDFDMDVKLNESGKLRFKAFNHYNDQYINPSSSTYTQGVGFLYQEDFNTLNELFRNYWEIIAPDKKEKNESTNQ